MAERETGEFELVLGNKQLFSVLFLVIALLGIFFAMGYLAGKSGSPAPGKESAASKAATPPASRSEPPAVIEARNEPERRTALKEAEPSAKEPAKETPAPKPSTSESGVGPPDGKYLQAAALPKSNADAMVRLFRRDGQPAHAAAAPGKSKTDEPMFRVLVGPFEGNDELAKAREYLKEKGIEKPIPRTYPDARSN